MNAIRGLRALPLSQPIRHRVRARQDFEDSCIADQLKGPEHPALAMLAAAQAPRRRIVLPADARPKIVWPALSEPPSSVTQQARASASAGSTMADVPGRGHDAPALPAPAPAPVPVPASIARQVGIAALAGAFIACTWLLSIYLPEWLGRFTG
ncbi:hypothetical protein GN316_04810 [Xylophilus sp. Kf1]|nr:hypothetical protein [Xylophilus sp. Kf1]